MSHTDTARVLHLFAIKVFFLSLSLSLQIACQRGLILSQCDSACLTTSLQSRSGQGRPFCFPFVLLQRYNILRTSLVPTSLCTLIIVGWHTCQDQFSLQAQQGSAFQFQVTSSGLGTAFPWFTSQGLYYLFHLLSSFFFVQLFVAPALCFVNVICTMSYIMRTCTGQQHV